MTARKPLQIALLLGCLVTPVTPAYTSLFGPWLRFQSRELGFEIPVAQGWKSTPVANGIVFAMQLQPDPYVRVAIGRLEGRDSVLDTIIDQELQKASGSGRRSQCRIDGKDAVQVEGISPQGPFRDLFVKHKEYYYWLGFAADRQDLWSQYSKTFEIILEGFHFL